MVKRLKVKRFVKKNWGHNVVTRRFGKYSFKENNENDMTFCYFSCLGWYCFRPTSMAALQLLALASLVSIIICDSEKPTQEETFTL